MGPCPEYILDTCPSALVLSCPQSLPSHHCQRPFSPADKSLVAPEAGYKVMSRSPSLELEVLQSAQAYFLSTSSLLWATSWAGCPSQPPYGHISRHLLGLLLSRDAVPAISICEPFHAWRLSSAVTSLRPLPPAPTSGHNSLHRDGELPWGALTLPDQEGSQVVSLHQNLFSQLPGNPAQVPPAERWGR